MQRSNLRFAVACATALSVLGSSLSTYAGFVSGDIIRLGNAPGRPGGLFDVTKPGDPSVAFQTLCSHVGEDLDFDTDYMAIISDTTDPGARPVGPLAAWLYTQFLRQAEDQLPGFDFDLVTPAYNSDSTAEKQARALQLGIWLGMGFTVNQIESNSEWSPALISDLKTSYLDSWLDKFELSGWGPSNNTGRIKILNLYERDDNGNFTRNVQDQLIEVPEPGTAALLGMLVVCAWPRRFY